jgi:K+-sensing histidine kinase KdpD
VQESLDAERRAYGQISREDWQRIIQSRSRLGYRYEKGSVIQLAESPAKEQGDNLPKLEIPIHVRNQKIGTISAHKNNPNESWTDDETKMMTALARQMGDALESARLYQDTQRRAAREQALSELSTRFSRSLDIDAALQTAVRELGQLLDIDEISVYVEKPEETQDQVEPSNQPDDMRDE